MSITFEKVDDILTNEAREELINKYNKERDWIKQAVIDVIAIANSLGYHKALQLFDSVVDVNDSLNAMTDIIYEYNTAYSTLLEKYQEVTKETE